MLRVVHGPRHNTLTRRLAVLPELCAIRHCECRELDREHVTAVPEILARDGDALADVRAAAVWEVRLRVRQEAGMPESEQDTRGEDGLPVRLCGDDLVHEGEEVGGLVLDLHVDIELDVLVLGL